MVKQVKEENLAIKKPYAKHKDFRRAIKRIDKWLNVEKTWTFALLGLAIAASIAFICNIFLCKYMKCFRANQSNM